MFSARILLVALTLCSKTNGRPLNTEGESNVSPASITHITDQIIYWLRHTGWFNGASSWRGGDARGSDVNRPGIPFNEGAHLPFGLGGALGGWAWGENEISVVVRIISFPFDSPKYYAAFVLSYLNTLGS